MITEPERAPTFPAGTVTDYAERVKLNKPQDAKFIQLIRQAVLYRSKHGGDDAHAGVLTPPDLSSVLEIWQETDRADRLSLTEQQLVKVPCLDQQTVLQTLERHARSPRSFSQRYMAFPIPHLPCTSALRDLESVDLDQLVLNSHNRGKSIALKKIGEIVKHETRTLLGVIDSGGNVMFLELSCTDLGLEEAAFHEEAAFAIKEPFVAGGRHVAWSICVDHPTDLVKMHTTDAVEKSAAEWKAIGNSLYKERRSADAADAYENGLQDTAASDTLLRDLHRNLAQVYLSLEFWDRAKLHADRALDVKCCTTGSSGKPALNDNASTAGENESNTSEVKALYRASCASYALQDFEVARVNLQALLNLPPQHTDARRQLLRVYKRLNEQKNDAYDFDEMLSQVRTRPLVDAACFTKKTTVSQSAEKGNGLFAANDFSIGDLVLCEKALAADFSPDTEPMRTYDTSCEAFGAISAALWRKAAHNVIKNPSLASRLLRLRGNYEGLGEQHLQLDGNSVIDVFQVHNIVARNSFGIPTPGPQSAKADQWGLYTTQSGAMSGTNTTPRNSAIFSHAAFINHSCLPNVEKRFIGDVIIIRATRPIAKGKEILLNYAPGEFNDARSRRAGFKRTWQFECDCQLCEAESLLSDEVLDCRVTLIKDVNELTERLSRAMPASVQWKAEISRLERLAEQLKATYSESEMIKFLAYTYTALALLHGAGQQFLKHVKLTSAAFESMGWCSPLDTGGRLQPKPQSTTSLDLNIPQLL